MSVWGEQQLQEGSVCKIHIYCKQCKNDNFRVDSIYRTLIKAIGCVTGVVEVLCLKTSAVQRSHLVKRLMVLLVLHFNREIRYQRNH